MLICPACLQQATFTQNDQNILIYVNDYPFSFWLAVDNHNSTSFSNIFFYLPHLIKIFRNRWLIVEVIKFLKNHEYRASSTKVNWMDYLFFLDCVEVIMKIVDHTVVGELWTDHFWRLRWILPARAVVENKRNKKIINFVSGKLCVKRDIFGMFHVLLCNSIFCWL